MKLINESGFKGEEMSRQRANSSLNASHMPSDVPMLNQMTGATNAQPNAAQ